MKWFFLLLISLSFLGVKGQDPAVNTFIKKVGNVTRIQGVEQGMLLLDSGISLFRMKDSHAAASLEVWKASMLKTGFGWDTSVRYIDSIIHHYDSFPDKSFPHQGVLLSLKAAEIATQEYDFKKAVLVYKMAALAFLKQDSSFKYHQNFNAAMAYNGMGMCYGRMDSWVRSIQYLNMALASSADTSPSILINLAQLHSNLNNCDRTQWYARLAEQKLKEYQFYKLAKGYGLLTRLSDKCSDPQETIRLSDSAEKYNHRMALSNIGVSYSYLYSTNAYLKVQDFQHAEQQCDTLIAIKKHQIIYSTLVLSSQQKASVLDMELTGLDQSLSTLQRSNNASPALVKKTFEYALFLKQYPYRSYEFMKSKIKESSDSLVMELYAKWIKERENYYGKMRFSSFGTVQNDSVKNQINEQEKELCRKLNIGSHMQDYDENHFAAISEHLHDSELAIEFVRYEDVLLKEYKYGAFIIHLGDTSPQFISLCKESELELLLDRAHLESEYKYIQRIYNSQELYNLIWKEIMNSNPETKKVYASLSGLLNYVSHDAIKINSVLLIDKVQLVLVNSTQDINQKNTEKIGLTSAKSLLIGGVSYDIEITGIPFSKSNVYEQFRGQIEGNWQYLENTSEEVLGITKLLPSQNAQILQGAQAAENKLKEKLSSQDYQIIHIATHGLYLKSQKEENSLFQSYSYTHSGLVLSGANTCHKKAANIGAYGDGVLTAPEISSFDLSNTRLVVLSACESGLGQYSNVGTSYGLQKAFKVAGARYVVYSLWKVPDAATKEFMLKFYKQMAQGLPVEKAFREAKRWMRLKHGTFEWAAFQLIG